MHLLVEFGNDRAHWQVSPEDVQGWKWRKPGGCGQNLSGFGLLVFPLGSLDF